VPTGRLEAVDTVQPIETQHANVMQNVEPAYEIHNPSFNDMTLDQQIEAGVNEWCAEGASGHPYFGRTKEEAEKARARFQFIR
jgi:hypothetical protein